MVQTVLQPFGHKDLIRRIALAQQTITDALAVGLAHQYHIVADGCGMGAESLIQFRLAVAQLYHAGGHQDLVAVKQ